MLRQEEQPVAVLHAGLLLSPFKVFHQTMPSAELLLRWLWRQTAGSQPLLHAFRAYKTKSKPDRET